MYYVYVLISNEGDKYIGFTCDIKKRVNAHNDDRNKGYTKGKSWKLVYYEAYLDKKDALIREKRLKQDGRAKQGLMKRIQNSLLQA